MKSFRLKANVIFKAEDVSHALHKLSAHFDDIAELGTDAENLFDSGEIELSVIHQVDDAVPDTSVSVVATPPTDERIVDYFVVRNDESVRRTVEETLSMINCYGLSVDKVEYVSNLLMEEKRIPRSMKWRRRKCGEWLANFLKARSCQRP